MAASPPPEMPSDDKLDELLATARAIQAERGTPARLPSDGPLWRLVDAIGRVAVPIGLVATVIGFALSSIGPEWAWASLLYLITLVLFIIYIPALIRTNARRQYANEQAARERLERARSEVARMIIEGRKEERGKRKEE